MSELITLKKTELLSLLRQAYEEGWAGFKELAVAEADHLLDEFLKKNPGTTWHGGSNSGPMPPPMGAAVYGGVPSSYGSYQSSYTAVPESAGVGRDGPYARSSPPMDSPINLSLDGPPEVGVTISAGMPGMNTPNINGNVYNSNGFYGSNDYRSNGFHRSSSVSSASSSSRSSRDYQGILRTPTLGDFAAIRNPAAVVAGAN